MAWIRTYSTADGVPYRGIAWGWVLLMLTVLIAILIVSGVVYFRQTEDTTEIIIDRAKLEAGAEQAAEQSKRVLRVAGEGLQRLSEENDKPKPTTSPQAP